LGTYNTSETACDYSTTAIQEVIGTLVNIYTERNTLTIESSEDPIISVSLYDVVGKKLFENKNLQTNIFQYQTEFSGIVICIVTLQSGKQRVQLL